MADKWCHAQNWHVRTPGGGALRLNTEEAADYLLGLQERVAELEAQLKKRQRRRARAKGEADE